MQVATLSVPTVLLACAVSGCVVAPYGPQVYGPRVYVEPALVVVPGPYAQPDWRYGRGGPHWSDRQGRDHRR